MTPYPGGTVFSVSASWNGGHGCPISQHSFSQVIEILGCYFKEFNPYFLLLILTYKELYIHDFLLIANYGEKNITFSFIVEYMQLDDGVSTTGWAQL